MRGIGVDVVAVERFAAQLARTPRLVERLFVPAERGLPLRSLAARFAVKEATAKALGAPAGMNWQHCWVETDDAGAPVLRLCDSVAAVAAERGIARWHVSISHDGDIATGMVIAEGEDAAD
ncbi:holo-ACP synthase [Tersicoccus solisilvae]|uniref:holo-ACP synthase n=1 Tax=Tersicoccus solisilvae TaxID=1882339 RepID=UPI0016657F89|nr:holo-ACP synthase [Tersicoccus solisilvae]